MGERSTDSAPGSFEETPGRVDIALAIPIRAGRIFATRRAATDTLGGYWEFPGGKIEPGETPGEAAQRELQEETGLRAGSLEPLVVLVHDYSEMPLRFHCFLARGIVGQVRMDAAREWGWMSFDELRELRMPPANQSILRALRWRTGQS